jgi:MFS family permease
MQTSEAVTAPEAALRATSTPVRAALGSLPPAFYLMCGISFLVFLATGSASPFLSLYITSLQGSLADVGWVVGGYSVASMISNIGWGRVTDSTGRRKPLVMGAMGTLMVTTTLIAHVSGWQQLVPLRIIEGFMFGAYSVGSIAMLGDLLDSSTAIGKMRGRILGIYRTGGSLAFAISIVIAGKAAEQFGYHVTYSIAGIMYALAFVAAIFLREPRKPAPTARPPLVAELGELFKLARGPLLPLVIAVIAWSTPFSAVYSVWPVYIADAKGLGSAVFSQLWALAAFLEVPSMIVAGYLADRIGRARMFAISLFIFSAIFVAYAYAPIPGGLIAAQVVRGFAFASFTATALTAVVELAPVTARGRAAGVYQLALALATIVGNSLGGPLASTFGYVPVFVGAAVVTLSGSAVVLARGGRTPRPDAGTRGGTTPL